MSVIDINNCNCIRIKYVNIVYFNAAFEVVCVYFIEIDNEIDTIKVNIVHKRFILVYNAYTCVIFVYINTTLFIINILKNIFNLYDRM